MHRILQDLRFAFRRLVKDRWFTLAAIAALALGIGANSAVFTLVNAVLLRGLPFYRPDRIMWIDTHDTRARNFGVSLQDFEDWRRASRTFAGMTLVQSGNLSISGDDRVPENQSHQVRWLILRRGLVHLAFGLVFGLAGAFGVGRLLRNQLFQTGSADPVTLVSITVLLVIVAIAACLWPAWQATRLNPVASLRYE